MPYRTAHRALIPLFIAIYTPSVAQHLLCDAWWWRGALRVAIEKTGGGGCELLF